MSGLAEAIHEAERAAARVSGIRHHCPSCGIPGLTVEDVLEHYAPCRAEKRQRMVEDACDRAWEASGERR